MLRYRRKDCVYDFLGILIRIYRNEFLEPRATKFFAFFILGVCYAVGKKTQSCPRARSAS